MIGLNLIVDAGLKLLDRVIPNPEAKAAAQLELMKLAQSGELATVQADTDLAIAQNRVNEEQAKSNDKYTSRARPTLLYICCAGFAYTYVLQPFLILIIALFKVKLDLPTLDMEVLGALTFGLAGLRTFDKFKRGK